MVDRKMDPESEFMAASGEKFANGFAENESKKMEEEVEAEPELDKDDAFEFIFDCDFPGSPVSADVVFLDWKMKQNFPLISSASEEIEEIVEVEDADVSVTVGVVSSRRETAPLRKLMELEKELSFSSESDEIESLAAGSYCVWNPAAAAAAENGGKGKTTTGPSKRWKLLDLLRKRGKRA